MGEIRVNLTNFLTIGLMAFLFMWLAAKGMVLYKAKQGG